ncbi:E3 ubiquitin/ISG15 ligase TRIM25-like [Aquarana catesbeiana]|uniref:E3 ubiquitin/ISG15 ligase TRIM25-like n=1 Tax=Aquarana catesbeiana TaxID=8400 RepID=UPI003CCA3939
MASSDLSAELYCTVCLNIYTDPVMLNCGHNFCRVCIDRVFDTQEESEGYSCPQCREEFQERPSPPRNITLRNITQHFLSAPPEPEKSGISCTYCIHTSVPTVKSCLLCEASLCYDHLRVHSKSPEHVLCDPTTTPEKRKCSVHKKILEYYCTKDSAAICASCALTGEHRGHQVETLKEAFIKKKKKLTNNLEKLITKREKTDERVRNLQEYRRRAQRELERVTALFGDIMRHVEDLEKKVLSKISMAEDILHLVNDLIQQLELKSEELSRKLHPLQELWPMTDPLTVLQISDTGDLCDTEDGEDEYIDMHDKLLHDVRDLDGASHMIGTDFTDIITGVTGGIVIQKAVDILLDEDTAHTDLCISYDKKTATKAGPYQPLLYSEERFMDYNQVLGSRSFSSGRHYWEVDLQRSNNWIIGMCYASIDRDGGDSLIGRNDVSWGLDRKGSKYKAVHDKNETVLHDIVPGKRVRVCLDYEAGQISFYMGAPLRHLHTFTATFTEPLYAVLGVWHSYISLV